jgi:CRP-like cAMP-binding protein
MLARSSESTGIRFPIVAPGGGKRLDTLGFPATMLDVERDAEVIREGTSALYCYEVLSGCLRTVRLLEDGRRQIGEFLLPGDLLGWESAGAHGFGAEAVTRSRLRRVRRDAVESRADRDPAFARQLRAHAATKLGKAGARIVLLGRKAAAERIADFLLEMNDRLPKRGAGLELPMGRADIADYLGMTTETVCRILTDLRRHHAIETMRASIRIIDPARLSPERCN